MKYYLTKIVIDEKHETFKLVGFNATFNPYENIEKKLREQYPYAQEIIVYETIEL